jgi:hypothetical protein
LDKHKLDLHIREHGHLKLTFRTLDDGACWTLRERLASKLSLGTASASVAFTRDVLQLLQVRVAQNAEDPDFDLVTVFERHGIKPRESCYVNFHRFDRICEFLTTQLATYLDDIWYPGPDDIEIFDDTLTWMISVDHDGNICAGAL